MPDQDFSLSDPDDGSESVLFHPGQWRRMSVLYNKNNKNNML